MDLRPNKFAGDILVKAETASTPLMKINSRFGKVGARFCRRQAFRDGVLQWKNLQLCAGSLGALGV